jgi:N4-(beta-N-acetylglucosaminyl)-L-asparaginase
MDHDGRCGSVAFVRNYEHVASIARRVMEKTKYIMLVGDGAERFAEAEGFTKTNLHTAKADALYNEWIKQPDKLHVRLRRASEGDHEYVFVKTDDDGKQSEIDRDKMNSGEGSHDTIGILAMDTNNRLAGACTTSGLAFKLHGRVGDSPIVGAGLFVDGEVGAAVATGDGELMMRACSSFHIVDMVRQGIEPGEACERAIKRIARDKLLRDDMQCGVMVIRADGVWAARSLRPGFQLAAACDKYEGINKLYDVTDRNMSLTKSE